LVSGQAVWLWQLLMLHQLFRKPLLFILAGRLKLCQFLMLLQLMLFMLHWLLMLRQILMLVLMVCTILLL
jgi:hypothetical protein